MEIHGAQPVGSHADTYRIPDETEFGDACSLTQNGDTLTIVNAPPVEDLSLVYEDAAPEVETTPTETESDSPPQTDTPTDSESPDETDTQTDNESATGTETAGDSGPGFTIPVMLVALAALLVAASQSW